MRLILIVLVCMICSTAVAETKMNPVSGKFETLPDGNDWHNRENPVTGEWSYQPDNARVVGNAPENTFEWDSGHNEEGGD